jgi:hypothetical protein
MRWEGKSNNIRRAGPGIKGKQIRGRVNDEQLRRPFSLILSDF